MKNSYQLLLACVIPCVGFSHGIPGHPPDSLGGPGTAPAMSQAARAACESSTATNEVTMTTDEVYRYFKSNGIPKTHGEFPNDHNPNMICPRQYSFKMPLHPVKAASITPLDRSFDFGIAMDGVPFDTFTAEYWNRDRRSGWNYVAMHNPVLDLGLDMNDAHVQTEGEYHYHGSPAGLFDILSGAATPNKPILVGYAADGFPMYNLYGYVDPMDASSGLRLLTSSYQLKQGTRASGPGGAYDGRFVEDYEYVSGSGDLDQCNGRYGVTPEAPQGQYYYMVTNGFPNIPQCYMGTPDASFITKGPNNQQLRSTIATQDVQEEQSAQESNQQVNVHFLNNSGGWTS